MTYRRSGAVLATLATLSGETRYYYLSCYSLGLASFLRYYLSIKKAGRSSFVSIFRKLRRENSLFQAKEILFRISSSLGK